MDPHTVEVQLAGGGVRRVTAKHILIAAGGRAVKAPIEGAVSSERLTCEGHTADTDCSGMCSCLLQCEARPPRITVAGGELFSECAFRAWAAQTPSRRRNVWFR